MLTAGPLDLCGSRFHCAGRPRQARVPRFWFQLFTSTGVVYGVADPVVTDLPMRGVSA